MEVEHRGMGVLVLLVDPAARVQARDAVLRVLLVGRRGQEEGREERPHGCLVLGCTKFGAASYVRIAARASAPIFEAAAFYAVFKRCGAPEFAMWAALIFLLAAKMAVFGAR